MVNLIPSEDPLAIAVKAFLEGKRYQHDMENNYMLECTNSYCSNSNIQEKVQQS